MAFLKQLKFTKNPILWLGFFVIVGQTIIDWRNGGGFDSNYWWNNLLIAGGAIIGRQLVSPVIGQPKPAVEEDL